MFDSMYLLYLDSFGLLYRFSSLEISVEFQELSIYESCWLHLAVFITGGSCWLYDLEGRQKGQEKSQRADEEK
jgi:hypothetical protein